jgi:hypothetical protein
MSTRVLVLVQDACIVLPCGQSMHQYMVTLAVQVQPGVDEPPIAIKVQMADSLYASKDAAQRQRIIETCAEDTFHDPRGNRKIWPKTTAAFSIEVTDVSPIKPPTPETDPVDYQAFSDVFAWLRSLPLLLLLASPPVLVGFTARVWR